MVPGRDAALDCFLGVALEQYGVRWLFGTTFGRLEFAHPGVAKLVDNAADARRE